MPLDTADFPADLLALLRQPLTCADAQETIATFFARPALATLYQRARDPLHTASILQGCATLLPELPPQRAAMLALMCGTLVEDGADPRVLFPVALDLLHRWLQQLQPYCAEAVEEDDTEPPDPAALQAWEDAHAQMAAVPRDQRWEVELLHQAADLLVLPLMTMVLRDRRNHADFLAHSALQALLATLHRSDSLPFEQLYYLVLAADISYEDALAVVLPASGTGFIARVHAANNGFHAFSMLQRLIRHHGQALRVRPEIWDAADPASDASGGAPDADMDSDVGDVDDEADNADSDTAAFQWLQATAYAGGQLVNPMAWAWGEAPLRSFASRQGLRVLIALDGEGGCSRRWSGFTSACHAAQDPHVEFQRYLTPQEVAALLD